MYKLDPGSDVFFINDNAPIAVFRNTVRSHISDFGPVIGGFVVLANFFTGNFTNPTLNGGVYFDRADYDGYKGGKLRFSDEMTRQTAGLHAISIMGWGVAKSIQYDNDTTGDVPYWHCRNSWGDNWGNDGGYFKMAMYPFNKISQFDNQVMTDMGGPVGSMILIRATKRPETVNLKQISRKYTENINKQRSDKYYKAGPEEVRKINRREILDLDDADGGGLNPGSIQSIIPGGPNTTLILIIAVVIVISIWSIKFIMR
ncbi:MAG: hypothetical protein E4H07_09285 [Nitrosomonadales bacterium]|nr:MAG: hypothetical protein E4H07_09285 [Nitrosomonadales bacterium]